MLRIIESAPMKTKAYDLIFDFGPNMFDRSNLVSGNHQFYGIFEGKEFVGFGKTIDYEGYFSGKPTQIYYFGNCFIHPKHYRKGYFTQLIEFFITEFNRSSPSTIGYFVFLKGNNSVDRFFKIKAKEIDAMPIVKPYFNFSTKTLIPTKKRRTKNFYNFRLAENNERQKVEEFLKDNLEFKTLTPSGTCYNSECKYLLAELNGLTCGLCEIVDLTKYKKTRILRFKKGYNLFFYLVRLIQKILGYPILPHKKESFKELYINRIFCNENKESMELDFVNWIYNYCCDNKFNLLHIGSYSGDPSLSRLKGFLSLNTKASVLSVHRPGSLTQYDFQNELNSKPFIDFKLL